ncbi:PAS domain S-box protein [Desulfospira joergensenii]|uniref:PAS domain S-box protein n=1 Tax=Desulfospira joergensenii TaxID=53329 RepID=UPI0003B3B29D|nr:PAS domain S-box protein [Desulfospira joergensenii]
MGKAILRMNIVSKLIIFIGFPLLLIIAAWAYFNINFQNQKLMKHIITDTNRLTETIRLGTHYAMTLNSRDDITQIIQNIGKQQAIEKIHIYNKAGEITFSNIPMEKHKQTLIKDEACDICHRTDPPLIHLDLEQRIRIFRSTEGYRLLGIITPIYNEPGCSTESCHFHPPNKKILGALDVVVSLEIPDKAIKNAKNGIISLAIMGFLVMSIIIFLFVHRFIHVPIQKLIQGTVRIAGGEFENEVDLGQKDELGQLAEAINSMGRQIRIHQNELHAQRDEYRTLFDDAPCMISVQDRNFKLLRYNRQFLESFDPQPGSHCFQAYKGRDLKCDNCPVEKTFQDGKSHSGEESGIGKDGTRHYWIFITSPIKNAKGEVVSAIEMSLNITQRKKLEKQLEASEKKYQSIFNNIPNPVFVLDKDSLDLIDCNQSVESVYGFQKEEILGRSLTDFFMEEEKDQMKRLIKTSSILNQVRQKNKEGKTLFVDIWISPSEFSDKKVLLVTTSDITKRLETEQDLIQAGKMATLGEMSTGIAHELNQPLSVIKTASDFILKKIRQEEKLEEEIHQKLLSKINTNVDRASKIIEHMRHFARKSDINFEPVNVNEILKRAHDIFSQQLKVRGIEVVWQVMENIPEVTADPGRLEQVFINLLVNARDAIEEKNQKIGGKIDNEKIILQTLAGKEHVIVKVIDTGIGISDAIREKIFEPFFTTKEVGKGTGIGLSISYGIIKECKGDIGVSMDTETRGTCFTIRFPFSRKENGLFRQDRGGP